MSRTEPSAMTLIEVLAALAILAVMLAGITTARTRLVHQWAAADRTLAAVAVADELMGQWQADGELPGRGGGTQSAFDWELRELHDDGAEALGLRIVRLELWSPGEDTPTLQIETVWPDESRRSEGGAPVD